jgi:hypothetical protein
MQRARTRKRPCRICRKWFMPDPRQIGRQNTCSDPTCRREDHRRQCSQWNRKNRDSFKANYLSDKLARSEDPPAASPKKALVVIPAGRIKLDLPRDVIAQLIGAQELIILEYLIEQMMRHGKVHSPVRGP